MSVTILALVLAAANTAGAPAGPLSLGEVLVSTRASFPLLVAARADVDAADGEQQAAAGAFDPLWRTRAWGVPVGGYPQARVDSVVEVPTPLWGTSLFGGYRWGGGKIQSYYGERETWTAGEVRAGAVVPLVRNGPIDRRRATEARAVLGQSLARLTVEQQQLELSRLAAVRYWEWAAAGQRREVARGLLRLAQDRDRQLAARTAAGDLARFDRQDNTRALLQREALLVQAQRGLDQAAFELSLFLRDELGAPLMPAEERLPVLRENELPPELAADVDAAVSRRPDVKRLLDQKQQAELEVRLQFNQLLPSLDVGVAVSKDLGASRNPDTDGLGPAEVEFTAMLEVPLLFRAPQGRLKSARAASARLDAQLNFLRERVAVEVRDARSALAAATERLGLARQELKVALELEEGKRTRFALGESSLVFVNLREQTTGEARLREVDAMLDGQRAVAALRAALAVE